MRHNTRPRIPFLTQSNRLIMAGFVAMAGASGQAQSLWNNGGVNSWYGAAFDPHSDGSPSHAQYTDALFNGSADASAQYGVLHAYAHAKNLDNEKYSWAIGLAQFSDELTLKKGPGAPAGNTGYFIPTFTFDGSMQADFGATTSAGLRYWSNDISQQGEFVLSGGTHTYAGSLAIPFTYGVAFDFTAYLTAQVIFPTGGFGEGTCDFAHTARLTSFDVLDGDGNTVDGYLLSSASGTNYPAVVPEPCSMLALAGGTLALLRRKRSVHSSGQADKSLPLT